MKKLLLSHLFSIFLFQTLVFALPQKDCYIYQSEESVRSSFQIFYNNNPISTGSEIDIYSLNNIAEIQVEVDIQNTSSKSIDVHVAKEQLEVVAGTQNYFCWGLCYPPSTDTSSIPLTIRHLQVNSEFSGHLSVNNNSGINTIKYTFFNASNSTDQVFFIVNFISYQILPPNNLLAELIPVSKVYLLWEAPLDKPGSRNPSAYNVYRDGGKINGFPVQSTNYTDQSAGVGSHFYHATALYPDGESEPSNIVTVLIPPPTSQSIVLEAGWNIFSSRLFPKNPDMLNVLQTLMEGNILVKVLDESGGSIFHLPFPPPNGQWSNTIGDMENTEGYYLKVNNSGTLCVEGQAVETPLTIPLTTGWNIIGYPCEYAQNALDAVQALINAGVLTKVIDESGGSIFHLPFPPPNGQWSNTIGNLQSGEGYYVKVTGNAVLTIDCPAGPTDLTNRTPEVIDPVYFNPVYQNNPYSPMHIVLSPCEELQSGDEIAVFDGSVCVGAAVVNGDRETPIIITTSQHDPASETPSGFTTGDQISLMVWNSGTGEVSKVEYEYLEGSQTFAPLETMFGELKSGIFDNENPNTTDLQLQVIPNPFAQKTSAMFFLRESGTVKMHIQNMNGITMDEIPAREMEKGQQNIALDLQKLGSGIYFLLIEIETENSSNSYIQKLIKM